MLKANGQFKPLLLKENQLNIALAVVEVRRSRNG